MGNSCSHVEIITPVKETPDIVLAEYKSQSDAYLKPFEKDVNLFSFLTFSDFVTNLQTFQESEVAMSGTSIEEQTITELTVNDWELFLAKRICKHSNFKDSSEYDEQKVKLFIIFFKVLFFQLLKAYNNSVKTAEEALVATVEKKFICAFGVLYCSGRNLDKIKIVFDLLAISGKLHRDSQSFNKFLFFLLFNATLGPLTTINVIKSRIPNEYLTKISKEELNKMIENCSAPNLEKLTASAVEAIFDDKKEIDYLQFFEAVKRNSWLFQLSGIRSALKVAFK